MTKKKRQEERVITDWLFERVLETLMKDDVIVRTKKMKNLYGYIDSENTIWLNCGNNKTEMKKTLLHEIFHIIFPNVLGREIYNMEKMIWNRLDKKQRRTLGKFIP